MSELKPYWADAIAKGAASKDEHERAEALGFKPRRCFRRSEAATQASRVRGGQLGRCKRPLPPPEDEED